MNLKILREHIRMVDTDAQSTNLKGAKSLPVTIVATYFLLQGLWVGYSGLRYGMLMKELTMSSAAVGIAVVYGIMSVVLIVAAIGLLARIKACLTVSVIIAGLYLLATG